MLTFATVGSGWITDCFIESAHSTGAWKLTSVFSRKQSTADAFAKKHGITGTHISIDELAADKSIDAVYIASPNSLHYAHAKSILSAGKHVILEKPAASNVKELEELFAIAKQKKTFLLEAYRHIQEPNFKILQSFIQDGKLGPIYAASLNYASYSSRYTQLLSGGEPPQIFTLDFSGGSLVDIGVYPICASVALFGKPQSQTYKPFIISTGADGGGIIVLNYPKFAVSINASKIYDSTAPSEVFGEKGTLRISEVARIDAVNFWSAETKETVNIGGEGVTKELNMAPEAKEFARIIDNQDGTAAEKLKEISLTVQQITEDLRRQNGLVFKTEKK
jgi:predicted dehydrogenase